MPRKATKRRAQPSSPADRSSSPAVQPPASYAAPRASSPKAPKRIKNENEFAPAPDLRASEEEGVLLSVGQGDVGQLGLGEDVLEKSRPAVIPHFSDIVGIAAGGMHNVCLTKSGKLLSFGCNDEGALGRDTSKEGSESLPGFVQLPEKAVQISAGDSHSAALLHDGRVFAWGSFRDSHGTMGLTSGGNERTPVEILPNVKVVKIASGSDHLVMLTEKGHVYTCGCAEQGQLGRICARSTDRYNRHGIKPLLTPGLVSFHASKNLKFQDIWAGSCCTFAKEYHRGDVYVCGLNNYHQIGLNSPEPHFYPKVSKTFGGRAWRHISSGLHHTVALDETGQVYVLGRKEYGRLGLGPDCSDVKELTPVPVLQPFKCLDIATGSAQSFAVTDAGDLYAWGMGSNGQLGTGDEEDAEVPTLVVGKQLKEKKVLRVAGGGQHTLILAVPSSSK
ncbi:regulator of chromosome condensation [Athalia rosae]|uniref:regulator of chromosome condensation n=1 Tax=Athalia rosae TaxID=37344 RepID=UPI0006259DBA|nr:regulator of chromosome condensation [Athalia rosae]